MRQLPLVSQQEELTEALRASQQLLLSESLTEALAQAAGHKVVRSAGLYLDQLCDTGEHDRFATMLLAALRFQTDGAGMRAFFGGPEGANKCVADNWNAAHGKHQGTYWGAFEGWSYDSLYNWSFAHVLVLTALRSELSEYSTNLRLSRSLDHFR